METGSEASRKRSHAEQGANVDDAKPAAATKEAPDEKAWAAVLKRLPRCDAAEGLRETSCFRNSLSVSGARKQCFRKLLAEIGALEEHLPTNPAIWLRFDEETPQFLRALITGPTGTPYALGLFCFDIYVPDNYPQVPPMMQLLTTGGGTVRFSPNLYADGKVCLSLLNTWQGPKWNASHSSLLQVLVSIQALILGVEHPFYLEPGNGGWEGRVKEGTQIPRHVKLYEDRIREGTAQYAMLDMVQGTTPQYLAPFQDVIAAHFFHFRDAVWKEAQSWQAKMENRVQQKRLKSTVTQLHKKLWQLTAPNAVEETSANSDGASLQNLVDADAAATQPPVAGANTAESIVARKRLAIEQAATRQDYITAGRLQSELLHGETYSVESRIANKRQEMQEAATKGDYITAGQRQHVVQYLEKNLKRMQHLESRMFGAAAQLDFIRAGRFQDQYLALLQEDDTASSSASAAAKPSAFPAASGAGFPIGVGPSPKLTPPFQLPAFPLMDLTSMLPGTTAPPTFDTVAAAFGASGPPPYEPYYGEQEDQYDY